MFLHLSVILFTGGVVSQHALQVVSQHTLQQVSMGEGGIPACLVGFQAHIQGGGKFRGLARGVSRPTPGGSPGPHLGRSREDPHRPPPDSYCCRRYASYWKCILVTTAIKCVLFIVIRKMERKIGLSPIRCIIHTVTIGTILNFNGGNNRHGLKKPRL